MQTGPTPCGFDQELGMRAEGVWRVHTWTARSFRQMFAERGFICFVPAFWATRVLKNAPVVATASEFFDPATRLSKYLVAKKSSGAGKASD